MPFDEKELDAMFSGPAKLNDFDGQVIALLDVTKETGGQYGDGTYYTLSIMDSEGQQFDGIQTSAKAIVGILEKILEKGVEDALPLEVEVETYKTRFPNDGVRFNRPSGK